jgi:hypothetical protein
MQRLEWGRRVSKERHGVNLRKKRRIANNECGSVGAPSIETQNIVPKIVSWQEKYIFEESASAFVKALTNQMSSLWSFRSESCQFQRNPR